MNRTEAQNRTTAQKISGGLTGLDQLIDQLVDLSHDDDLHEIDRKNEIDQLIHRIDKQSKVLRDAQKLITNVENLTHLMKQAID